MKTLSISILLFGLTIIGCDRVSETADENLPVERQEDYRQDSFEDSKDYPAESTDELDISEGIFNRK